MLLCYFIVITLSSFVRPASIKSPSPTPGVNYEIDVKQNDKKNQRAKRFALENPYDYYRDTDYYNYYGVEDPYYDEKWLKKHGEFSLEKSIDVKTQLIIVLSIAGLLIVACIWFVCCYPMLRICGWYCTYWGALIRMALDMCRGRDPRYRLMETMMEKLGFGMPPYGEWKRWMQAYDDMLLAIAEGQCSGLTDALKGLKSTISPFKNALDQGRDNAGVLQAAMMGVADGIGDVGRMPMGGVMF